MMIRRDVWKVMAGAALASAIGKGQSPALPNVGVKADTGPLRSESGVGALMPWADVLWAVTYVSHRKGTGTGTGLYAIDERLQI